MFQADLMQGIDYKDAERLKGKGVLLRAQGAAITAELEPLTPTWFGCCLSCPARAAGSVG